jgi:hypothetical protein
MPTDMSPREDHKSTWHLLIGGVIAVLVIGVGLALLPMSPGIPSAPPAATGLGSGRASDEGTAARPIAPASSAAQTTVDRAADIAAPPKNDVVLNPKQRKTIDDFAVKHAQDQTNDADVTIAIVSCSARKYPIARYADLARRMHYLLISPIDIS